MPELPEVETVRRGLAPTLVGRRFGSVILNRPDLRFPFPNGMGQALTGAKIEDISRRGKYLILATDRADGLIIHLGMSGRLTLQTAEASALLGAYIYETGVAKPDSGKHDHVIFHFEADETAPPISLVYHDPRRFGFMDLVSLDGLDNCRHFAQMGPEPLSDRFGPAHLAEVFKGKKSPIKSALLDQANVAGLGNIYVCEALFLAHIHPERPAADFSEKDNDRLYQAIIHVLEKAISYGGSTLKDFANTDGESGAAQEHFYVYDRLGKPCSCGGKIEKITQSGRSTFYCNKCQK